MEVVDSAVLLTADEELVGEAVRPTTGEEGRATATYPSSTPSAAAGTRTTAPTGEVGVEASCLGLATPALAKSTGPGVAVGEEARLPPPRPTNAGLTGVTCSRPREGEDGATCPEPPPPQLIAHVVADTGVAST